MRCIRCLRAVRRLNGSSVCPRCWNALDVQRAGLKRDRFWLVMVGIPLAMMAALGTMLVVAAMAR